MSNIEGLYYTTVRTDDGATITRYEPERAAAWAILARARDKADAMLLLDMCGLPLPPRTQARQWPRMPA